MTSEDRDQWGVMEKKKLMLKREKKERLSSEKNEVKKNSWLGRNFRTNDVAVKTNHKHRGMQGYVDRWENSRVNIQQYNCQISFRNKWRDQ